MTLAPGALVGVYEILRLVDAGGMGEVYKARDTRLGRSVALKVLHSHLADDIRLRERFEREARAVSALNHPRICTLYDVGRHDQKEFLVMEFVDGETLAARLSRGKLPIDVALRYAIEIAEGLDHAHGKGITHRDVKPGNVMLTRSGLKLLDFGVAKLRDPAGDANEMLEADLARLGARGAPGRLDVETVQASLTESGMILGTLEYLAPEQLQGHPADERTDVFAFGAVLYEMVTGRQAFESSTRAGVIGAVLMSEPPPMRERRPDTPPLLEQIVQRCLAKDPDERWQRIKDVSFALRWVLEGAETTIPSVERKRLTWLAAAVAALALVALGSTVWRGVGPAMPPQGAPAVWNLAMPAGQTLVTEQHPSLAVSHDGSRRVFRMGDSSDSQLFLQRRDQFEPVPILGTAGAHTPFFSPDDQWIGFLADSRIYRVSASGGAPRVVGDARSLSPGSPGASWGPDDTIVFAAGVSGLMRVSVAPPGQEPELLTTPDVARGEAMHVEPQFLPNGQDVLFTILTSDDQWRLAILSLETKEWEWLPSIGDIAGARYVDTGHLIYAQSGALFAIPLDLASRTFTGSPSKLADLVYMTYAADAVIAHFAVSDTGLLLYASGAPPERRLVSVAASDAGEVPLGASLPRPYRYPRFSPDGKDVAVMTDEDPSHIYVLDARSGMPRRLTRSGSNIHPVWGPESRRLAFASRRSNSDGYDVYVMPIDDEDADADVLIRREGNQYPTSWVGGLLAFYELGNITARDIFTWSLEDGAATEIVATRSNERGAVFSPDGSLLAYVSDRSGGDQVYVRGVAGPGNGERVSTDGGTEPAWNPSGQELFFWSGNRLQAVRIRNQPPFVDDPPRTLFEGSYVRAPESTGRANYDPAPDGRSFVMVRQAEGSAVQLHVIENWQRELTSAAAE